jgi:hypothetical protein
MAFSDEQFEQLNETLRKVGGISELDLGIQKLMNQQTETLVRLTKKMGGDNKTHNIGQRSFTQNMSRQLTSAVGGIYFVGKAVVDMANRLEKLQKATLARGLSLQQVGEQYAETTHSLNSNLTGYGNALEIFADQLHVGLTHNSYELNRLGAYTKVTGGNTKSLFKQMAKNTLGLGITAKDMQMLSHSTVALSQNYGLTTEELMSAVGKLSAELVNFGALGIGAEMNEASLRLAAALGPSMAELGPQLLSTFTQGSGMIQAQLLGVSQQREALLRSEGNSTKAAFDLLLIASDNAQKITKQWTQGAKDPSFMMLQATKIYGKEVGQLIQARKQMERLAEKQNMSLNAYIAEVIKQDEIHKGFRATWSNFKERVLSPFQKLFDMFAVVAFKIMNMPYVAELTSVIIGLTAILSASAVWEKMKSVIWNRNTQAIVKNAAATAVLTRAMLGASYSNAKAMLGLGGKRIGWQHKQSNPWPGLQAKGPRYKLMPPKERSVIAPHLAPRGGLRGFSDKSRGVFGKAAKSRLPIAPTSGIFSKLILPLTRSLGAFARFIPGLGTAITLLMLLGDGLIKGFKSAWNLLMDNTWIKWLMTAFSGIKEQWGKLGKSMKGFGSVMDTLGFGLGYIVGALVAVLFLVLSPLLLLAKVLQWGIAALNDVGDAFNNLWDKAPDWMKTGDDEGPITVASVHTPRQYGGTAFNTTDPGLQSQVVVAALGRIEQRVTEQNDLTVDGNDQRETANNQRAEGQAEKRTRPTENRKRTVIL